MSAEDPETPRLPKVGLIKCSPITNLTEPVGYAVMDTSSIKADDQISWLLMIATVKTSTEVEKPANCFAHPMHEEVGLMHSNYTIAVYNYRDSRKNHTICFTSPTCGPVRHH